MVATIEARLRQWRVAEDAACDAEASQATDPKNRDLSAAAITLRTEANCLFTAIVRSVTWA